MNSLILAIIIPFTFSFTQSKYDIFNQYWYTGKAEITSYELTQSRYGETHKGNAVLIFVSEDFSKTKQVKLDWQIKNESDKVSVLKLNFTKNFNTGIYPYSMLNSVFTPINIDQKQPTLKVSTSVQEWCGHVFSQLNRTEDGYDYQLHSYFESEGEQRFSIDDAILEDEIWNLIRLNPVYLPEGKIKLIPGAFYNRLRHKKQSVQSAEAHLDKIDKTLMRYKITYPKSERSLTITFKSEFPYEIQSWEETMKSGFGKNAKPMTTKATLIKRIQLDYWTKNKTKDLHFRTELGLN